MASCFHPRSISAIGKLISEIKSSLASSSDQQSSDFIKDMERVSKKLQIIQAVLEDSEEREIQEKAVKLWLSELKDVAYDAEDVLDELHYELLRARVERRAIDDEAKPSDNKKQKVSHPVIINHLDIMKVVTEYNLQQRIKDIIQRLDEISEDRNNFWLGKEHGKRHSSSNETYNPPPTTHEVNVEIFGRENDKEKVVELLLSQNDSKLSVVAIIGKGGLGKTTLAQLVYNDNKVKTYFQKRSWIDVRDGFDVVGIAKKMMEDLTSSPCESNELSQLKMKLDQQLKGEKLILVLDNVWSEKWSLWESLENLMVGASLVRILITARNVQVTKFMKTVNKYSLDNLPDKECWKLLENCAFSGVRSEPSFMEIGKKIVKKCQGLPLAVRSLGCLLRYEHEEDFWNEVFKNNLLNLPGSNEILPALKLSYDRMPNHLKSCFAYCSVFPKGHKFNKNELGHMWVAQGFIEPEAGKNIEDMAMRNIDELLSRSFFEFDKYRDMKMHDMFHDLASFVSNGECGVVDDETHCSSVLNVRHIWLFHKEKIERFDVNPLILRTFVGQTNNDMVKSEINLSLLQKMSRLRVLRLDSRVYYEFLIAFGNFKHLRYLGIFDSMGRIKLFPNVICYLYKLLTLVLSGLPIDSLPPEIEKLVSLQNLYICKCSMLKDLPSCVGELSNLCRLDLRGSKVMWFPPNFGGLKNLEFVYTPNETPIQAIKLEVLKNLVKLRVPISVCDLQNIISVDDARKAELKNKNRIGTLHLLWRNRNDSDLQGFHLQVVKSNHSQGSGVVAEDIERDEEAVLHNLCPHTDVQVLKIGDYPGARYPRWLTIDISDFIKLTKVTLVGCRPPCLPSLGQLPLLKNLFIEECEVISIEKDFYCFNNNNNDVARRAAFPALVQMHLYDLTKLEEWCGLLDCDFPKLQYLDITGCYSLVKLPNIQSASAFVLENNIQQQPCSNVQGTYPSWKSDVSFILLKDIILDNCNVTCIPTLGQLPLLKHLCIKSCPVKIIGREFCWSDPNDERRVAFPELTELELENLREFEEWCGVLDGDFPKLKNLSISHCFKLCKLPCLPPAIKEINLHSCSELETLTLAPNFVRPSTLKRLILLNNHKLRSLLGLHNFSCQQVKLIVKNCDLLLLQEFEDIFKIASDIEIEVEMFLGPED